MLRSGSYTLAQTFLGPPLWWALLTLNESLTGTALGFPGHCCITVTQAEDYTQFRQKREGTGCSSVWTFSGCLILLCHLKEFEFIFRKEFTCLWRCGWLNKVNPRLQPALISGQDLGMPISASCTLLLRVSIARLLGLGRCCCLLQQVQTPEGPGLPNNKCLCYSVDAVIMAGLCMTVSWLFPWDWLLPLSSLPSHASTADLPKVPFSTTVMLFSS